MSQFIHPSMGGYWDGFHLLAIAKKNGCYDHRCTLTLITWCMLSEVELLDHIAMFIFQRIAILFSTALKLLLHSYQHRRKFLSFCTLQTFIFYLLLSFDRTPPEIAKHLYLWVWIKERDRQTVLQRENRQELLRPGVSHPFGLWKWSPHKPWQKLVRLP